MTIAATTNYGLILDHIGITALWTPSSSGTTNLIQNGGFENAQSVYQPGGSWWTILSSNAAIAPWYKSDAGNCGAEIDYLIGNLYYEGSWGMDLNGNCAYAISQNVTITPGTAYTLSFKLHYNPCGGDIVKTGYVQITGSPALTFSISDANSAIPWQLLSYTFTAGAANSVVTIGSTLFADSCGPVIDDVQLVASTLGGAVSAIPAPVALSFDNFETGALSPFWYNTPSLNAACNTSMLNGAATAYSGVYSVNLNANSCEGSITTIITTVPGQAYRVTFQSGQLTAASTYLSSGYIAASGGALSYFVYTPGNGQWQIVFYDFVASGMYHGLLSIELCALKKIPQPTPTPHTLFLSNYNIHHYRF